MVLLKAIFLDRDGVINKLVKEGNILRSPRLTEEFEYNKGILKFIIAIKELGYLPIVVSNQPEVKRGLVKKEMVDMFHNKINIDLGIERFYVCFHDEHDNCECRKPKPGLIINAARELFIDIQKSYLVGDREKDMIAAHDAGCRGLMLSYWTSTKFTCFDNFDKILEYITYSNRNFYM